LGYKNIFCHFENFKPKAFVDETKIQKEFFITKNLSYNYFRENKGDKNNKERNRNMLKIEKEDFFLV